MGDGAGVFTIPHREGRRAIGIGLQALITQGYSGIRQRFSVAHYLYGYAVNPNEREGRFVGVFAYP